MFQPEISLKIRASIIKMSALLLMLPFPSVLSAQVIIENSSYQNPDIPVKVRVDDLVSRMSLEEKVSQMLDRAPAIPRLHIQEYDWWNECLHGVGRAGVATVFPQAIGMAATWNPELILEVADAISTEARAKHHEAVRQGDFGRYKGLTFWSPNINIFRDPRWGRGQETYGEDPYLTSRFAVSFIKGLQGDDPKYFKLVATPKHYAVHSGPEPERHEFNAITNKRDLYDTYLPAFEASIKEAGAFSVMCAYNAYLGQPCCANATLQNEILRDKWGFKGYIVSDCGAIDDILIDHQTVKTEPEAAAISVKGGTDLNCGDYRNKRYHMYKSLVEAVEKGLITEMEIDIAVKRLFMARFKLGMFDPPEMVPYTQIPYDKNNSEEHRRLSLKVAQESIVLLKNENKLLPLKNDINTIAVIGPTADSYVMLLGNYHGTPSKYVTPLQGIKNKFTNTEIYYEKACNLVEEGGIMQKLSSEILRVNEQPGLKAEYFNNTSFKGEPFFTKVDQITNSDLVRGAKIPELKDLEKYSIRWSGKISVPQTGEYNFKVTGDDGYRLSINSNEIVNDWAEHDMTTKNGQIYLEKGKSYDFKLEYFQISGKSRIYVSWQLLTEDLIKRAVELAKKSEVVIFIGGITADLEGEETYMNYEGFRGGDRTSIDMPKVQEKLLKELQKTGKPIVLVLTSGSALAVNWAKDNIPAIIQLWYPGQEGGNALADVLLGEYNPAGRLPVTFYKSVEQLPEFTDYSMKERTYKYFDGEPLFPFGYGLSYTHFEYANLEVSHAKEANEVKVTVQVINTGEVAGDEVVQLYIKDMEASAPIPIRSLQGVQRIHVQPGEIKKIEFILSFRQLAVVTEAGEYYFEPGEFEISVGGAMPGSVPTSTQVLNQKITIKGEAFIIN